MGAAKVGTTIGACVRGAAFVAVMTIVLQSLMVSASSAQSGDLEMSCAPESVAAGATTTCNVAGVAASTRATIEVRSAGTVVGQSSAIAGTDGRAAIQVEIPAATSSGQVTLALRGTTLTFDVTVTPNRPTSVSAGLSPSSGDVERGVPIALMVSLGLAVALGLALPRRTLQD